MPSSFISWNKLDKLATTPNIKMRRYLEAFDFLEVLMGAAIELISKEVNDLITTILTRWQANAMHNDYLNFIARISIVAIKRWDVSRRIE